MKIRNTARNRAKDIRLVRKLVGPVKPTFMRWVRKPPLLGFGPESRGRPKHTVLTLPAHYKTHFDEMWTQIMTKQKKQKQQKLPSSVKIRFTRQMARALVDRVDSGFYGRNLAECVERILCEAIRS